MDTTAIKQEIDDNVKTNGTGAITGAVLNKTLNDMVDDIAPKLYSENVDDEIVEIQTSLFKVNGESVRIITAGGNTLIEGDSINFESKDHNVLFYVGGDGLEIVLSQFFSLEFNTRYGFQVQLHDGNDPYVMKFDLSNGLQFGSVNIETRLDDLQEKKADKVIGATAGHLVTLDSNGNVVDSGISIANLQKRFVVDDIEQVDENLLTNALEVGDVLILSTTMYQPKQAYVAVSQTIVGGQWVFASANKNDITFVFYENNEYVNTVVVPIG